MDNNTLASGVSIYFTREEIEWLTWAMNEVLGTLSREDHTAKDKIVGAQELLAVTDKARGAGNQNVG